MKIVLTLQIEVMQRFPNKHFWCDINHNKPIHFYKWMSNAAGCGGGCLIPALRSRSWKTEFEAVSNKPTKTRNADSSSKAKQNERRSFYNTASLLRESLHGRLVHNRPFIACLPTVGYLVISPVWLVVLMSELFPMEKFFLKWCTSFPLLFPHTTSSKANFLPPPLWLCSSFSIWIAKFVLFRKVGFSTTWLVFRIWTLGFSRFGNITKCH